jgi:hypothetical protein
MFAELKSVTPLSRAERRKASFSSDVPARAVLYALQMP